ncbi:MAG: phasin family protein, partial [Pseudomonadota bacterium]
MANEKAKSLRDRGAELEAQTRDVAQKIWLAGLGAYGRAFSEAIENAQKLNEGTSELFEDLVERGTEIETDMKTRLTSNERVQQATAGVTKVTETALRLQREQRERFEARMQRMRTVLGFNSDAKADDLSAKLDRLEDEIAALSATATKKTSGPNKDVTARLARLSAEIDAIAGTKAPAKRKVTKKPAAKKSAATTAKKTATAKA